MPGGVRADCTGLEQVLVRYCWNGENWRQTTQAIDRLRRELSAAIGIRDANSREQECLRVCLNIVRWGGERSSKVGASLFLTYVGELLIFETNQQFATHTCQNIATPSCLRLSLAWRVFISTKIA